MKYVTDIAVIGGGASGLAAAISAKRQNKDLDVYVVEALSRVGKKLITTGNGRCNITNKNISLDRYHGQDVSFADFCLGEEFNKVFEDFFMSIGVPFTFEEDKAYPASLQASSVVDCLRFECDKLGVKTICDSKVTDIKIKNGFTLSFNEDTLTAKAVIVAGGLFSGGASLGSDGSALKLFKNLDYKTVKTTPAIVKLKTDNTYTKQLKGIKVLAKATLLNNGKPVRSFSDEVLFCDFGLSGPAVLQISRDAVRDEGDYFVSLDLFENLSATALADIINDRKALLKERSLEEFFTGFLNKRLGQVILKYCGYTLSDSPAILDAKKVAFALKDFRFKVLSHTGFNDSQVTAGGLLTEQFDKQTFISKKHKGLFAVGEILDIDGDCGGFNLRFAFMSGILAGKNAAELIGK